MFLRTMDVNFTRIFFIFSAAATGIVGILINVFENYLPVFITRTYRSGKYGVSTKQPLVERLELPKRWFKHFYIFAAPASIIVLALTISKYLYHNDVPAMCLWMLDLQLGNRRQALVSPESTLLAIILLTIQCWKRLYETQCVSIYSDGKMHLSHYLIGFVHYIGAMTCVVGESEGFVRDSSGELNWSRLTNLQYVCAIIFLLASFEQLRANFILANLRKDKDGTVVTKSYKIPRGRLFEYISSPLQLTEITMYAMLSIILWKSSTYHYVFFWVLVNQAESATLTHSWYLEKFRNYPEQRKVLIPFLY